jgi:sugar lactone lactonase YvrE
MPGLRALAGTLAAAAALATSTAASAAPTVVARHLDRPRGLAIAPDGTLYAALVGHGGKPCNREGCFGASGRIVRVGRQGKVHGALSGLLSMRGRPDGFFSIGADQVTVLPDGRLATAMTAEFEGPTGAAPRAVPRALRPQIGHLLTGRPGGRVHVGANIAGLEFSTDPDGEGEVSNPYGVTHIGAQIFVSDSAANDVLSVRGGVAELLDVFPHAGDAQSVPDALTAGPDNALYVGEFTGGTQAKGSARIWRVVPGQAAAVWATGLTSITALAAGADGSIYAAEFLPGRIVRITAAGDRTVIARRLHFPGGIAVGKDGTVYVSDWSVAGATPAKRGPLKGRTGRILRIAPAG